ncbi:hypothetical protein QR680_004136 [Steinernema hermaphroditum]|uniref:Uncharacterized protein n=1 Tax=Steinernema hermaphroditum TaxID=289476 RepID=A0AA39LTH9_9BILA|nr:hypothetical protein QR680_004136 [Steinernema hermaphroditum]
MLWTIGLLFVFLIDFCSAHRRQGNDAFTFGEEQRKVFHVVVANKRTIGIYLSLDVDACGAVKGTVCLCYKTSSEEKDLRLCPEMAAICLHPAGVLYGKQPARRRGFVITASRGTAASTEFIDLSHAHQHFQSENFIELELITGPPSMVQSPLSGTKGTNPLKISPLSVTKGSIPMSLVQTNSRCRAFAYLKNGLVTSTQLLQKPYRFWDSEIELPEKSTTMMQMAMPLISTSSSSPILLFSLDIRSSISLLSFFFGFELPRCRGGADKDQQSTLSESVDNRTEAQDFENISYFVNTEKTRNSTRTTKKTSSDSKRRSKALDSPKKETIEAPGAVSKTVISEPKIEKASSPSCHIAQQLQIEQTPEEKADRRGHEFRIGFIVTSIVYVVFIDIHAIVNTVIVVM